MPQGPGLPFSRSAARAIVKTSCYNFVKEMSDSISSKFAARHPGTLHDKLKTAETCPPTPPLQGTEAENSLRGTLDRCIRVTSIYDIAMSQTVE